MYARQILDAKGRDVIAVGPDTVALEAAKILVAKTIGAVVILDTEEHLLGLFTERDLVRATVTYGAAALTMAAGQLTSKFVPTCRLDESVGDLKQRLTDDRTRHLPVVDDGRVIGMISIGDVVKQSLDACQFEVDSLKDYVSDKGYAVA